MEWEGVIGTVCDDVSEYHGANELFFEVVARDLGYDLCTEIDNMLETPYNENGEIYPIVYDSGEQACDGTEEWLGSCCIEDPDFYHEYHICVHSEDMYLECSYPYEVEEEFDNGWLDLVQ